MKKILNEIKDRIYEAEGLLELLQLRGDRLDDLRPLILARIEEARGLIASLSPLEDEKRNAACVPEDTEVYEIAADRKTAESEEEKTDIQVAEVKSAEKKETALKTETASVRKSVGKPAFCLNDRFRFRRAIFAGSQDDFNAAMDHLATLDSYDEAEAFFIGDMALDPEDQDVADFLNIIKEYFEK